MTRLRILEAPHPLLKRRAAPVETITPDLERLLDDMLETMYAAPGVGLAAPQVGVLEQAVVIDISEEKDSPVKLLNPEIVWTSAEEVTLEEGCLSLPEQFAEVKRPDGVRVRYMDEAGARREIEGQGILARCLLHEVDHLHGILFVDRISAIKRNMILRRLAKQRRVRA